MQTKRTMSVAGNLLEEVEEVQKLIEDRDESIETDLTQTRTCNTFLTLICC